MEISILVLTYNHERFIQQALDSVFAQDIDLPYEVLVCDDASTDNTQAILRRYQKKNPHRMKTFHSKHNRSHPTRNFYHLAKCAKGRYLAILEGDDFWFDSQKLIKQFKFLEENPQYSACVGTNSYIDEDGNELNEIDVGINYPKCNNDIYTIEEFRAGKLPGHTATFFARNHFDEDKYRFLYRAHNMMGDYTFCMLCLLEGPIYQMKEVLSVRRIVQKEGKTNFNSIRINNKYHHYVLLCFYIRVEKYLRENFDSDFHFPFVNDMFLDVCRSLPIKPIVKLIWISSDKWRYAKLAAIRCLLSADYAYQVSGSAEKRRKKDRKIHRRGKRIVIFGAGECAREYLDNEGWRESVLFIVDNDHEKWDKSLKGYLIKNPEALLPVKNKVTVLIANLHSENEIAGQLEAMGISDYYSYRYLKQRPIRHMLSQMLRESL